MHIISHIIKSFQDEADNVMPIQYRHLIRHMKLYGSHDTSSQIIIIILVPDCFPSPLTTTHKKVAVSFYIVVSNVCLDSV